MNWYKLAKNEGFLENERELADYLKQFGFDFSHHGGRHHVYCHKRRPEFKIFVSPHSGAGYSKPYIKKIQKEMFDALDRIEEKDNQEKEEQISQRVEDAKENWKNSPWYQKQLEYTKSWNSSKQVKRS